MPESGAPGLAFFADLTVEVGDERGSTTALLTNGGDDELVLEVPDPAVLLRCVPGRGLSRDLPISVPMDRLADVPVRLTSRGRDLGRVHVTSSGKMRFRPSLSGVPTVTRTAFSSGPSRAVAAVLALGGIAAIIVRRRRRSR